jgi:lysophospholipase L1-like esterase
MRLKVIAGIVCIELLLIVALVLYIRNKENSDTQIVPLPRSAITISASSTLQYFYEPRAHQYAHDELPTWLSYTPTYSINKDTLNERYDYPTKKPANTFRIITLGDSYTFGLFVNTAQNFSERLEDMLNEKAKCAQYHHFEVINLGVPGYDLQFGLERLRLRGLKYHPDLVIWFLKADDFAMPRGIELQIIPQLMPRNASPSQVKANRGKIYDLYHSAMSTAQNMQFTRSVLQTVPNVYGGKLLIYSPHNIAQLSQEMVDELNGLLQEDPNATIYSNSNISRSIGINAFPDTHPNAKGHEQIAEDLYTYLMTSGLVPCGTALPLNNVQ